MSLGPIFHSKSAVSDQPPNAAFYEWNSPRNSMTIRLDVDTARRLALVVKGGFEALPTRGLEVGGLLLGRSTPEDRPTTIIEDFEPIESEHRRGPSYTLSEKDRGLLALQKPCIAGSRSRGNNQLKAKLLRPFGQRSDLLLTIPAFVVFGSF